MELNIIIIIGVIVMGFIALRNLAIKCWSDFLPVFSVCLVFFSLIHDEY